MAKFSVAAENCMQAAVDTGLSGLWGTSMALWASAMAAIFHARRYEEKRDALEMKRCREVAKGNQKLAEYLCSRRGIDASTYTPESRTAYRERQYEKLANCVRENIDLEALYRIIFEER